MNEVNYEAVLARKMGTMFPDPAVRGQVEAELGRYGLESYENGPDRVRLAVLKVAGTSIKKIREWVDIAKRDSRDVMAAAEYPEQLITPTWNLSLPEQNAVALRDKDQYLKWIDE